MKKNKERAKIQGVIGLIDVDHTLLFENDASGQPKMNENLIKSLKQQGINDIYLFTDMTFGESTLNDRKALVSRLEKDHGINVRGVIASPDFAWHLGEATMVLMDQFVQQNVDLKREKNLDKIDNILENIPGAAALCGGSAENQLPPGAPYAEVSQQAFNSELRERSNACKLLFDIAATKAGIEDGKGLLFKQFLTHLPPDVGGIVVVDDKSTCLSSVNHIHQQIGSQIPVCTIKVDSLEQNNYKQTLANFYKDNNIEVSKPFLGIGKKKAQVKGAAPLPPAPSSAGVDSVLASLSAGKAEAQQTPPAKQTSLQSSSTAHPLTRTHRQANLLEEDEQLEVPRKNRGKFDLG